jgi:uncharacterized protein YabE (DUF348 family)
MQSSKFKITVKNSKLFYLILAIALTNFWLIKFVSANKDEMDFNVENKNIILNDDGLIFRIQTQSETVEKFLAEQDINLGNQDMTLPGKTARIYSGMEINIQRAKEISVADGKNKSKIISFGRDVAGALWENNIRLGDDDIVTPNLHTPISSGGKIEIIRVDIREETVAKNIDFEKKTEEDDELSWRTSKIKQKGVLGKKEIIYRIVSHNGQEISRKIISQKIVEEPVPEITVQGTYMKLAKADNGAASWYNFTGQMTAANPWLPMGSYVKVTNKANGKSVVVKIVDRGPFGPGRIIDLEKVAFAKIASIGAGVVDVKMERILN